MVTTNCNNNSAVTSSEDSFSGMCVKEEMHSEEEGGEQMNLYRKLYKYTSSATVFGKDLLQYSLNIMSTLGKKWPKTGFMSSVNKKKLQPEERVYKCDVCLEKFTHVSNLNAHKQIHKPYSCSQCGKSFTFASNLKQHLRNHAGDLPFVCKVCGKGFMFQCRLEQHEILHLGNKSFECSECGKAFTRKSILKTHKMSHSGVKSFICLECGKGFTLRSHLNRHMKTHTDERPFYCDDCGKNFVDKSNFIRHIKRHTDTALLIKCEDCGAAFTDESNYSSHLEKHTKRKEILTHILKTRVNTNKSGSVSPTNSLSSLSGQGIKMSSIEELERLDTTMMDELLESKTQNVLSDVTVNISCRKNTSTLSPNISCETQNQAYRNIERQDTTMMDELIEGKTQDVLSDVTVNISCRKNTSTLSPNNITCETQTEACQNIERLKISIMDELLESKTQDMLSNVPVDFSCRKNTSSISPNIATCDSQTQACQNIVRLNTSIMDELVEGKTLHVLSNVPVDFSCRKNTSALSPNIVTHETQNQACQNIENNDKTSQSANDSLPLDMRINLS